MARIDKIAEEIAVLMPMIARRILLGFFQSVSITQTQIFTIMTIAEETPIRLSKLSQKLNISAPTVTGIVDRLEKLDYVKRIPDREDRRGINVDLTTKGRALAQKFKSTIKSKWKELLVKLREGEQEQYVAILRKIQRDMK
jgi:DNA-binding MarR family transcriptional regulator